MLWMFSLVNDYYIQILIDLTVFCPLWACYIQLLMSLATLLDVFSSLSLFHPKTDRITLSFERILRFSCKLHCDHRVVHGCKHRSKHIRCF